MCVGILDQRLFLLMCLSIRLSVCLYITTENFHEVTQYCYKKLSSHFSIHFDQMVYWLFDVNTYVHARVCAGVFV